MEGAGLTREQKLRYNKLVRKAKGLQDTDPARALKAYRRAYALKSDDGKVAALTFGVANDVNTTFLTLR